MPQPPRLTDEQRRLAYELSLRTRQARAVAKQQIAAAGLPGFMVAFEPDVADVVKGMKVIDLLSALPGIGKPSALKILERAGFKHPEKTTVRGTGPRQREALFALLTAKSPR